MVVIDAQHAFGNFVEGGKDESFIAAMRALKEKPHLGEGVGDWAGGMAGDHARQSESDDQGTADGGADKAWELADLPLDQGCAAAGPAPHQAVEQPHQLAGGPWDEAVSRRWRHGLLEHLEVMLATRSVELRDAKRQLTYYVTALDALAETAGQGGRWEVAHMLMEEAGPARPEVFRSVFTAGLRGHEQIEVTADALRFADGFALRFLRLPLLDALLEYVLTVPELGDAAKAVLDGLVAALPTAAGAGRQRAILDTANQLGRLLDAHLDRAVRSRDALERYRRIAAIVEAHSPPGELVFDDANLLRFWQTAAAAPEQHGDYRLFQTALLHFTRLARELVTARQTALYRREAERFEGAIETEQGIGDFIARPEPSLEAFAEGGVFAPLKLLNKREQSELELLVAIGRVVEAFAHSLLRGTVFGAVQNQMREAKRKRDRLLLDRLAALDAVVDDAYDSVAARLARQRDHLRSLFLAALAVAVHHDEAFLARGIGEFGDTDRAIAAAAAADREGLLKRARAAYAGNRREGFRDALTSPALGELFIEAVPALCELAGILDSALAAVDRLARPAPLASHLAADRPLFRATLAQLKES